MAVSFFRKLVSRFGGDRDAESDARRRTLDQFRRDVTEAIERGASSDLESLRARPGSLGLIDDDVEREIEMIDGALDARRLSAEIEAGGLAVVETRHRAIGSDACHFLAPATLIGEVEHTGRIILTNRRLLFLGGPGLSVSWSAVLGVDAAGRDLIVRVHAGARRFGCNSYSDAARAAVIAKALVPVRGAR